MTQAAPVTSPTRVLTDPAYAPLGQPVKPRLRGWLHAQMFPISLTTGVMLVVFAQDPVARFASAIFVASAALLFGVSALYHRIPWSPRADAILGRIDHSNIFILIAGTVTPFALLLLDSANAKLLLALVWGGALAGSAFRVFWHHAPRFLTVLAYVSVAGSTMLFLPLFLQHGAVADRAAVALFVAGGLLYAVGAVVYALERPNPSKAFGFHEVFHAFTVAGFGTHFVATCVLVHH